MCLRDRIEVFGNIESMSKILFVAFTIPKKWNDACVNYRVLYADDKLFKWTTEDNLHITLVFLGAVEEDIVPEISDALSDIASIQQPFSLQLKQVEYGPEGKTPSMIWARFKDNVDYDTLAARTIEELTFVLGKLETLKPIPHVTLARLNKDMEKPKTLPYLENSPNGEEVMEVTQMLLMESKTSQSGSTYKTLATFDFQQ